MTSYDILGVVTEIFLVSVDWIGKLLTIAQSGKYFSGRFVILFEKFFVYANSNYSNFLLTKCFLVIIFNCLDNNVFLIR